VTLLSLHRLRVVIAIVEARGVSSGARALGMTQSTASTHLRQLEVELDSLLIERTGKQFLLTEAGTVLLGHAHGMVAAADQAVDDLARLNLRPLSGALRVGATTTATEGRCLPAALQRFASAYPEVTLDLRVDNSATVLHSVLGGEVGVAMVASDVDAPALTATALTPEEQTVVVSGDHPLAGSATKPSVLRGSIFLLREDGSATRKYQQRLLDQWQIPGVRTWTLASTSAIVAAVAAGLGFSCLPRVACRDALALGRLAEITLEPLPPARPVCFVRRTDHHLTRAEEHFLALIFESAHRHHESRRT
jgi:LysR family transcriptional regulator, transcriptional activator of the cysJI operon